MKNFHAEHHIQSFGFYFKTFVLLAILMVATIVAAQIPDWFPGTAHFLKETMVGSILMNTIALGIASAKVYLVVSNFMGVKFADNVTKMYALTGFVWVTLMGIMFIDYWTRPWEEVKGWENKAPGAMPRGSASGDDEFGNVGKQQEIRPYQQ
ncbi:MAG: hypothetical protein K8R88_04340 [Armatimonadetes bacterium]|nr:hypothetical protein [Armatimonadota bacterium]